MPKKEIGFFNIKKIPWKTVEGSPGVWEKILNRDGELGSSTSIQRWDPGVETFNIVEHDHWEEVYLLRGGIIDKKKEKVFTEGMYACRPPGMQHGPYSTPVGCTMLIICYY
jgi:hypothetical protein